MTRVVIRLALADLRRSPARSVAVVVLFVAAAWLPSALDAPPLLGGLIAVAVAFGAAVGSVGLVGSRTAVLERNGARCGLQALVVATSTATLGTVAALVAATAVVVGGGPSGAAVVVMTVIVPTFTAPLAFWSALRAERSERRTASSRNGWQRRLLVTAFVIACVALPPLGLVAAMVFLASGAWSPSRFRRVLALVVALVLFTLGAFFVGGSDSWFELSILLFFAIPVLVVASAIVAVHAHTLTVGMLARIDGRFHLTCAPLVLRRRVLAPLVALVTVVLSAVVTNGVVGASFGEREARHRRARPPVLVPAGNATEQAIVPVPPVERDALDSVVAETLTGSGATGVVIDQVGTGDAASPAAAVQAWGTGSLAASLLVRTQPTSVVIAPTGVADAHGVDAYRPTWLGIVAPDDLALLGFQAAAEPLAEGSLVLVSDVDPDAQGTIRVVTGTASSKRPAVTVGAANQGVLLPGALVSRAEADRLGPFVTPARVVVVPAPGAHRVPSVDRLAALGSRIQDRVLRLPTVEPPGLTPADQESFGTYAALTGTTTGLGPVVGGAHRFEVVHGGPLNAVPGLSGTADSGRQVAVTLIVIPVLITLAVVFLALGATRREDVVLEVQGAPGPLRSQIAAIQTGVLTATATLVALVLGTAVPAACFAVYNHHADLPGIPFVVPAFVWLFVVGVPVGTTSLAALVPLARRRHESSLLLDPGGLDW